MFKTPLVIGVRQLREPSNVLTLQEIIEDLGQNTGNMMFTEALVRLVKGAAWGNFNFTAKDLEDRDSIILAAANWVNSYDDFGWLADRLEKTRLPVFLIGLGAQSTVSLETPKLSSGTIRLLSLVRDRSHSMSVRGHFSSEVLASYGFPDTVATGCPSLMMAGPRGTQIRSDDVPDFSSTCLHATRHLFNAADAFQRYMYRQALKNKSYLILQSELADMYLALSRTNNPEINKRVETVVTKEYGAGLADIQEYLSHYGRVFTNYESWIDFMRSKSFCLGTRIHGTVASRLAGTRATLIAHDSRTTEMAEIMGIPYVKAAAIDTRKDLPLEKLAEAESQIDSSAVFKRYYRTFLRYFLDNGFDVANQYKPAALTN